MILICEECILSSSPVIPIVAAYNGKLNRLSNIIMSNCFRFKYSMLSPGQQDSYSHHSADFGYNKLFTFLLSLTGRKSPEHFTSL